MKYYILKDEKEGPFDLLALIKKVNKGKITPETMIQIGEDETPVPAGELPELEHSFENIEASESGEPVGLDISQAIKNSKFFVIENITTVPIATGLFLLAMISTILAGSYFLAEIGAILGVSISYVFFGAYSVYIVEKTQGLIDVEEIINITKSKVLPLLLVGIAFGIPPVLLTYALGTLTGNIALISLIVAAIVFIEFVISTFVPFLIISKNKNFFEAIKLSMETTINLKKSDILKILFLNLLIIVSGFAFGLPLLFALPFVFATFAETFQYLFPEE